MRRQWRSPWDIRKRRLVKFGYASYAAYLRSEHWQDVRRAFYASKLHTGCCYTCFKRLPLQLHHKTYCRLGAEHLNDLIALCDHCHELTHERQRTDGRTCLWKAHRKIRKKNLRLAAKKQRQMACGQRQNRKNWVQQQPLDHSEEFRKQDRIAMMTAFSKDGNSHWIKFPDGLGPAIVTVAP